MTTQKTVQYKFELFCKLYNLKTSATTKSANPAQADFYSNNFVKMDYSSVYGGYRIDIVYTYTGESFFDKSSRMKANEMICYLDGLIAAKNTSLFPSSLVNELQPLKENSINSLS